MTQPKILLTAWAATQYSPAPSAWVLRRWARDGEIYPAPERVGRDWYVEPTARRQTGQRLSVVQRMQHAMPVLQKAPMRDIEDEPFKPMAFVFGLEHAKAHAREFYDPHIGGSGVYLVMDMEKTKCVYVGSSLDLSHRLRNGWHMRCDMPTFAFQVQEKQIRHVEATYWLALKPQLNGISPPGRVIQEVVEPIRKAWGIDA